MSERGSEHGRESEPSMKNIDPNTERDDAQIYQICIDSHLKDRWSNHFHGMTVARLEDGTTTLTGELADQSALHSVLSRILNQNLRLISVQRIGIEENRIAKAKGAMQMSFPIDIAKAIEDRSRIEGVYWGGALIWGGLVFAANQFGLLPQIGDASAWSWLFLGAGVYGLALDVIFTLLPERTKPTLFDWLWSTFWTLVGVSGFTKVDIFIPALMVIAGVAVIVGIIRRS